MDTGNVYDDGRSMRGLFENNHAVMLLIDPSDASIIDANPAAVAFYGWSREQFRGMKVWDINTLSADEIRAEMARAQSEQRNFFEFTHRLADGSERVVEVRSGPVDVGGRELLLSVIHDVTARAEVQRALAESERRLLKAEKVAGLGHWATWVDTGRLEASEGAHRIYGREGDVTLADAQEMVVDEYRPMMDKALEDLARTGQSYDVEYQVQRASDGAIVDVRSIGEFDPEMRVAFGVVQDITAYKSVERELERHQTDLESLVAERTRELNDLNARLLHATEAKSIFLASMSHELRTPLNSIIGFSGMLAKGMVGELTDEQRTQVEMIYRSGRHLLMLIDEILDLSRIEAGTVNVELAATDVCDVAREVVELLRPQSDDKGLEMLVECVEGPVLANTDPRRLYEVLVNLIGNAVKYTEEGEVRVSVSRAVPGWLDVTVSDTGPGIPAEELESIFDAFHQAGRADRPEQAGAGLGLAISREYTRLLGGTLSVESELGAGSRFTLRLPQAG